MAITDTQQTTQRQHHIDQSFNNPISINSKQNRDEF